MSRVLCHLLFGIPEMMDKQLWSTVEQMMEAGDIMCEHAATSIPHGQDKTRSWLFIIVNIFSLNGNFLTL